MGKENEQMATPVPERTGMTKQRIHVAVGFYLNGDYKVNYVRDADLENNIAYNRTNRPGRFYFVDGEYACGGCLIQPAQDEFIAKCKQRLAELELPERDFDSRPYI